MHFDSSNSSNMTENNEYNVPMDISDPTFMNTNMLSNTSSNFQTQLNLLDFNTQRQMMIEFPALSHLHGDLVNVPNPSLNESNLNENSEFSERFVNGNEMIVSASSLASILASRFGSRGSLDQPNNHHQDLNSAFATSYNGGYDTMYGEMNNNHNNKWIIRNQFSSNPCGSSQFDQELSLSLATCHPPIIRGTVIPDQCSEISGSHESQFGSKTSYQSNSRRDIQISQFNSGSRYLGVVQEILAQLASYSLEQFDQVNFPSTLTRNSLSRSCVSERNYSMMDSDVDGGFCPTRGREGEGKKQKLVALLEMVDEQHNRCLDEIHTVISAFHAATELDPRIHARFALQTVSALYKNLREKISNQILTMETNPRNGGETKENDMSFETSFIHKQWALQQLRKKDHQLWRPQRGLPERSVSVLRAWMFQNFLHPYPKDAEKHLLAVKSGLTRSQVSNWFINARVRLWKPMIEEMYSEMNRRKGRRNVEDSSNGHKSHLTIDNMRFDM